MISSQRFARRFVLGLVVVAMLGAGFAEAGLFSRSRKEPRAEGPQGDLAIASLQIHEITAQGGAPRYLLRAVVENRGDLPRTAPFRVTFHADIEGAFLGGCMGESLEKGARGLCEVWSAGAAPPGTSRITAKIDRAAEGLDTWDADVANDRVEEAIVAGDKAKQPVRIAIYDVQPHVIQGAGEVRFEFTVEAAHLVWLIVQNEEPRLVAGHPEDGVLTGQGRLTIRDSGPITLVARDLGGSYVYRTVPITNAYRTAQPDWSQPQAGKDAGLGTLSAFAESNSEAEADPVVLAGLKNYIAGKRWNDRGLAPLDLSGERKRDPGTAINPAAR